MARLDAEVLPRPTWIVLMFSAFVLFVWGWLAGSLGSEEVAEVAQTQATADLDIPSSESIVDFVRALADRGHRAYIEGGFAAPDNRRVELPEPSRRSSAGG